MSQSANLVAAEAAYIAFVRGLAPKPECFSLVTTPPAEVTARGGGNIHSSDFTSAAPVAALRLEGGLTLYIAPSGGQCRGYFRADAYRAGQRVWTSHMASRVELFQRVRDRDFPAA